MTGVESAMSVVTEGVFAAVLGCRVQGRSRGVGIGTRPVAAGCVQLAGGWHGALLVACEPALARRVAAVMLGTAEGAVTPDDVQDALRELANMIGGGLQGVLPQPCRVMYPVATAGLETGTGVGDGRTVGRFSGECEGWPFEVLLVRRAPAGPLKPESEKAETP